MFAQLALFSFLLLCVGEVIRNRFRIHRTPKLSRIDREEAAKTLHHSPITVWQFSGQLLSEPMRQAIACRMDREQWDAVDLIPVDLDVEGSLELLTVFAPEEPARTTGRAVSAGVAMAVRGDIAVSGRPDDSLAMMTRFTELGRNAEYRTARLLVPALHAATERDVRRRDVLEQRLGIVTSAHIVIQAVIIVWMIALAVVLPYGWVAVAAFHLQPLLIFGVSAWRPRDRFSHLLLRTPRYLARWWRGVRSRGRTAQRIAQLRPRYRTLLEDRESFYLPRLTACPLCDGATLVRHVTVPDMIMFKPGRFELDRCGDCGHVFQNPQLSPSGLAYYYRDCYDGIGESDIEQVFAAADKLYEARAAMVQGHLEPNDWLDVGTGHGHFCMSARKVWPKARFEGLDMGESVQRGVARGWFDRAWPGELGDHVDRLSGRFDVVSMFHYLEHTPNPQKQIDMAARLLRPGGMLMIEVPNPDSVWGRILGRFWLPWFQPQHLHFLSVDALGRTLAKAGMSIEQVDYLTAAGDLFCSAFMAVRWLAPGKDLPWRERGPGWWRRVASASIWAVCTPLLVAAAGLDAVVALLRPARSHSNAYRVLAARTGA